MQLIRLLCRAYTWYDDNFQRVSSFDFKYTVFALGSIAVPGFRPAVKNSLVRLACVAGMFRYRITPMRQCLLHLNNSLYLRSVVVDNEVRFALLWIQS